MILEGDGDVKDDGLFPTGEYEVQAKVGVAHGPVLVGDSEPPTAAVFTRSTMALLQSVSALLGCMQWHGTCGRVSC